MRFPLFFICTLIFSSSCSTPSYKTQSYAKLSNEKTFENEYETVWKGIQEATREYSILENDQSKGILKTDWIYSTSHEKYTEYQIDGAPRKKYLQIRYQYSILAQRQIGGVKVTVNIVEEVEVLKSDGTSEGWKKTDDVESSRQSDMLKTIEIKILSYSS